MEDGTRGQCRDDKDCTPWAPTCSPLGYCRGSPKEWDWDGSFGSPTNPKPDGPQSDWIKQNAKSGGARNEEYYGKIEDDNREGHVNFRKNNPVFYEEIPVLLPRLEKIEKNVYEPCTYCKYDPKTDDDYQKLVTRLSSGNGGNRRKTGNARNSRKNGNGAQNRSQNRQQGNRKKPNNRSQNRQQANRKKPNNRRNNGGANQRRTSNKSQNSGGNCLSTCENVCPKSPAAVEKACKKGCAKRCSRK